MRSWVHFERVTCVSFHLWCWEVVINQICKEVCVGEQPPPKIFVKTEACYGRNFDCIKALSNTSWVEWEPLETSWEGGKCRTGRTCRLYFNQSLVLIKRQIRKERHPYAMILCSAYCFLMLVSDFDPVLALMKVFPGLDLMFAEIKFGMRSSKRKYIFKFDCWKKCL